MIDVTQHDDITRLRMWTRRSAAVGYDVSAYLVRGVLVDSGFRHVASDLERALADRRPRGVIVTHWHEDHAGNAPQLATTLPMWMAQYTERKLREHQQVKLYRHFTGYPGGLVEMGVRRVRATRPTRMVEDAIFGMLPKTKLGKQMYRKLKVYAGDKHPHAAQQPAALTVK